MNYAFPKLCRIRKSWEYQRVWKMGCRLHTPHFILLLAENGAIDSRLGLTVSRKVGNAVKRNRVKRLVREFFRQYKKNFPVKVDFSVVAKKGAASLSAAKLNAEIKRALDLKGHSNG
jgi:ribonuclease P protein component